MNNVRIKTPPKETTVFELKIERLRQFALWGRGLAVLYGVAIIGLVLNPALKYPLGRIDTQGQVNIVFPILLYIGSYVLDFLADLGLIILSMKKESQYVTKVVQEVRGNR